MFREEGHIPPGGRRGSGCLVYQFTVFGRIQVPGHFVFLISSASCCICFDIGFVEDKFVFSDQDNIVVSQGV